MFYFDLVINFGRVSFGSVVFRIGYISDACYGGSLGLGQLVMVRLKIGYSTYRVNISLVSVEVRVEF